MHFVNLSGGPEFDLIGFEKSVGQKYREEALKGEKRRNFDNIKEAMERSEAFDKKYRSKVSSPDPLIEIYGEPKDNIERMGFTLNTVDHKNYQDEILTALKRAIYCYGYMKTIVWVNPDKPKESTIRKIDKSKTDVNAGEIRKKFTDNGFEVLPEDVN